MTLAAPHGQAGKRGSCHVADARIVALYRYPVKGFSPEPLERAEIAAGGTMPFDRAFAIENGPSGFDPAAPAYLKKIRFLMLMRDERIAEFRTRFDERTGVFRISRDGVLQVEAPLHDGGGTRRRSSAGSRSIFARSCAGRQKSCPRRATRSPTWRRRCCIS